jgi:hypothetical protein
MSCHGLRRGARFVALGAPLLTAVSFCMLATTARADSVNTQTAADAQCMVIGARLSASSDPQQRVPGQMILMYYLGRIDGRSPHADLTGLIKSQTQKMTESDLKSAAGRCGKEFSARGNDIVRIGSSLGKPAK